MDEEITILIRAVDNASGTLKNIENSVKTTADKSSEANEKLGNSFTKVQGAMLNLGQIAQGVHNIFEIQENSTRRLENATLRLQQANQSLADAEQKVDDIEKSHSRDGLTLEKTQISLEEAQKNFTETLNKYGATSLETRKANLQLQEAQANLTDAQDLGNQKAKELTKAQEDLKNKQDAVTIASNNVDRAQRQLDKTIDDAKWAYVDMGMQLLSTIGNLGTFVNSMKEVTVASKVMAGVGGLGGVTAFLGGPWGLAIMAAASIFGVAMLGMNTDSAKGANEVNNNLSNIPTDIYTYHHLITVTGIGGTEQTATYGALKQTISNLQPSGKIPSTPSSVQAKVSSSIAQQYQFSGITSAGPTITGAMGANVTQVGDAIIRPNGDVIKTDPNDTLIAIKNISDNSLNSSNKLTSNILNKISNEKINTNEPIYDIKNSNNKEIIINITGPIYGVSAQQISKALSDELNKKLSL